jgi:BirA family biotin operon repressor/biotin-[acetyl-CoA-carboxylase] ligase
VNIDLLEGIKRARGSFVPVADLGDDALAVARDLDELAAFGFVLERHPYHGVAYRGPARRLCPDQIEWQLGTRRIGRRIAVWNRVTSTNDLAARAASSRANDGLAVLAEEQTQGRGRRGRRWSAPAESSLLMSVLIFPSAPFDEPHRLTALGAVATAFTVEETIATATRIKWPNDVRVGGKKIAGILVERGLGSVIGIGLNVNLALGGLPDQVRETATSLQIVTGADWDRSELARRLLRHLDRLYDIGLREGPGALDEAWSVRLEGAEDGPQLSRVKRSLPGGRGDR